VSGERGRNKRLVLCALEVGPASTDELMTATGLTRHQVRSVLDQLARIGVVARPAGKYSMQMHKEVPTKDCGIQAENA
jgi:DNA-binding HxlR family transcriptional regulator